ncbi:MAG: DUF615 domain-containing protein [Polyangiaceae bacterium]|nr:DUF615 domain-containing protein [Myxococcales bacterium]MCB9587511.1 DUF615 domain-containing protein [Polyangiaceae bacterium]MCB9605692.1 DUF615 domain-containing protein [Polyangiaceae bacterium]
MSQKPKLETEEPETIFLRGNDDGRPSRTKRREEARAGEARVRELVEQLIALGAAKLRRLDLPEQLEDGILLAGELPPNKARQRQVKLLARHLAELDHETIRRRLATPGGISKPRGNTNEYATDWLNRLLAGSDTELDELLGVHPKLDRQQLRNWLRAARRVEPDGTRKAPSAKALKSLQRSLQGLKAPVAEVSDEEE